MHKTRIILTIIASLLAGTYFTMRHKLNIKNEYKSSINISYDLYLNDPIESKRLTAKYIKEFIEYSFKVNKTINTKHVNLSFIPYEALQVKTSTTLGFCFYEPSDAIAKIYINPLIKDPKTIWAVVFHELGHCLLNLHHDIGLDTLNNPISLMIASTPDDDIFYDKKEYYKNEIFNKKETVVFFINQLFNGGAFIENMKFYKIEIQHIVDQKDYAQIPKFLMTISVEIYTILSCVFTGLLIYVILKKYIFKLEK